MKRANKITDMQNWVIIRCVDDYFKNSTQYDQELNKTNRLVNQLISEFKKYSHMELSDDELIQNFYNFIDEYQKYMDLSTPYLEMDNLECYELNLVISSFLMEISRNNDALYNVFKSVFYGFILSRFIAKGTIDNDNKIKDLTVYVDTNYVLRILDFQSEYFTTSSSELLSLMQREGLKVVVMPEIVEEVQGVLTKNLETYSKNKENLVKMYGDRIKFLDGILGAFARRDLSLSEIQEEISEVEKKVKEKNISVLSHRIPDKIAINETERDKIIEFKKSKKNIERLKEDYAKDKILEVITKNANLDEKILSYIRHRRTGRKFQIEKCQHIFLTCDLIVYNTNKNLHKFEKSVPEAISETAFTNLLFMNSPKFSGDAPVKLLISIFKSSHYIDDSMLGEFHKNLKAYLEQNPEKERYLGLVFQNQQLFGNIIDGTEKEYTEESSYISRMFDEAIKKDSENAISFAEKEAALIKKNEGLQKLVLESVVQASEVTKPSMSEKEIHTKIADADKSAKRAEKFVASVLHGIIYFVLFCAFLFFVLNGNFEQFANTKEWWCNLCLFSVPFWFCSAFSFDFLKQKNIDKIINSKLYDESSSIKGVLIKSLIQAGLVSLLPICIGVVVIYLT